MFLNIRYICCVGLATVPTLEFEEMANKFEIIGSSLVVTDTVSSAVLIDEPAGNLYYDSRQLELGEIYIKARDGSRERQKSIGNFLLSEAVDSGDTPFTEETFRTFSRTNLSS